MALNRAFNFLATFPNFVDASFVDATAGFEGVEISGGQWVPGTLEFLRDELLASNAVSIDCTLSATQIYFDLGVTRGIKSVAIPDSTISRKGKVKVTVYDTSLVAQATTGWTDVWNVVYPLGTLPAWHPSFADGKLTEEDRASGYKMPWFHIFDDGVLGRYVLIEVDDTLNIAQFIRIPRLFIAGGWQSSINMKYGRGISYEPNTQMLESLGGTKFYEINDPRRVVAGEFDFLPQAEAYAFPLEMQRQLQNAKQLFISIDPVTNVRRHQNSFLATIREATPLEAVVYGFSRTGFIFEEVL